jgi:hypothetical protein
LLGFGVLRQGLFSKRASVKDHYLARRIPTDFVVKPTKNLSPMAVCRLLNQKEKFKNKIDVAGQNS